MEVGSVRFHDKDETFKLPTISISDPKLGMYDKWPLDWPTRDTLVKRTVTYLRKHYQERLEPNPVVPLSTSRPNVEEVGGDVHQRAQVTPWVNPYTNESSQDILIDNPVPVNRRRVAEHGGWLEFLERRREVNRKRELKETPVEKQRRESRIKEALKINQEHSCGPQKKSEVYR